MKEIVMTHEEILEACRVLGKDLSARLKKEEKLPVFVCVMKGAVNFMCDLIEQLDFDIITDYIRITSYVGNKTSGSVTLINDVETDLTDRVVVIVEDIIDTGIAMKYLVDHFKTNHKPKEVISVALLDKKPGRRIDIEANYVGKVLHENKFVLGYGLDYKELHRNDPYIFVPNEEDIKKMDEIVTK